MRWIAVATLALVSQGPPAKLPPAYPRPGSTKILDNDRVQVWNRWIMERGFKRVFLLAENTDYGTGLVEERRSNGRLSCELRTSQIDSE